MKTILKFATTPQERRAARELRDDIRRINLARFGRDTDGEADPRMDGRTLCAWDRGRVIGSIDVHWGADGPIAREKLEHHHVLQAAPQAVPETTVVLDEAMVHPEYATQPIGVELHEAAGRFALRNRARWVFSACHPTETGIYGALGFRACGAPNVNATHGEHVPIVIDFADVDLLKRVRSPFAELAAQTAPVAAEPEPAAEKLDAKAVWRQIFTLQRQAKLSGAAFLTDIQESEIGRLLLGSHLLPCKRGQRIIKRGEKKRDLFLILTGQVEVKHDGRLLAMLGAGDVVGEIGLVLDTPRTGDVFAATDDTTCLRISEEHLQEVMAKDPALAARISLGIAKALCLKLVRSSGLG